MSKAEEVNKNAPENEPKKKIGNILLLLASGDILLHMVSRLSTYLAIGATSIGLAQHRGK